MPRPPTQPRSKRGRAIVAHLKARGLGLTETAKAQGVSFPSLYNIVHHEPPPRVTLETVRKLQAKPAELPLRLIAPGLAS